MLSDAEEIIYMTSNFASNWHVSLLFDLTI
jgi:hypothetical protein